MNENQFSNILRMYSKRYYFRFCKIDEVDSLVEFLDKYWEKGHVLVRSRTLLDWQYKDKKHDRYNFILAVEKLTNEIHGVLGFISTDFYDEDIQSPMRWGAIWKIREGIASRGLGLAMKSFMYEYVKAPYAGGLGLSHFSKAINAKMGERMGKLDCFYMLNKNMKKFRLVGNAFALKNQMAETNHRRGDCVLRTVNREEFETRALFVKDVILPYKSIKYYVNRFFNHPFYKYECLEISDGNEAIAFLFFRMCSHEDATMIVIVDFMGKEEALCGMEEEFQRFLDERKSECISFYEFGIQRENMLSAGFQNRDASNIIIPLYFEPFEKRNVDLDFHYYNSDEVPECLYFFKADADQDRPNLL